MLENQKTQVTKQIFDKTNLDTLQCMDLRKQWSNIVKGVCWNCARILTTGGPSFLQQVLTRVW